MDKKILTIQDISSYGQCSITVALPILSAWGYETSILPTAILSTHTAGFKDYVVHDLSGLLPSFLSHWENEKIKFDVLYSAYLGEIKHIDLVLQAKERLSKDNALYFLDPVMGDNGKLYPAFDLEYAKEMRKLAKEADIIIPNLTEACLLSGVEYQEKYDESYIKEISMKLSGLGAKAVIITGISYDPEKIGISVYKDGVLRHHMHRKINAYFHGTGDIFSSTFLGAYLSGHDLIESSKIAAEFVLSCIENTIGDENHKYGVKFEPLLSEFVTRNKL